jgi:hypothetical protein
MNGRPNNGYLGKRTQYRDLQGIISNNKHYKTLASLNQYYGETYWLPLPNIQENEQKFAGLLAIYKGASGNTGTTADSNFAALRLTLTNSGHSYFVDWGDGNVIRYQSNVQAQYQYNWDNISSTTETPQGYKQVVIQAYPGTGFTATSFDLNTRFSQTGVTLPSQFLTPWLNIKLAGVCFSSLNIAGGGNSRHFTLKRVEFIGQFPSITSLFALFSSVTQLQTVIGLNNFPNIISTNSLFNGCRLLKAAPFFNTSKVTNIIDMFNSCTSLNYVPPYDFSKVTQAGALFSSCQALTNIPKFNTSGITNAGFMFNFCTALETIPEMDFSLNRNFQQFFNGNYSISDIPKINTNSGITFISMFDTCLHLLKLPEGLNTTNATNLTAFVNSCTALESFPGITTSNCTNFTAMFQNTILKTIPKIDTANGITFANMFNGSRISTIPNLDFTQGLCFGVGFAASNTVLWSDVLNTKSNISYANCTLSPTALDNIFTNLASVTGSQVINITNNWGSSGCDRTIATSKGWTVTG